jgi:hypothetical protein
MMLAAVHFDHQPGAQAGKIDDVPTHRNLTTEAKTVDLPPAQPRPEMILSIGHLGAETAGTVTLVGRCEVQVRHIENPLPDPPP